MLIHMVLGGQRLQLGKKHLTRRRGTLGQGRLGSTVEQHSSSDKRCQQHQHQQQPPPQLQQLLQLLPALLYRVMLRRCRKSSWRKAAGRAAPAAPAPAASAIGEKQHAAWRETNGS